MEGLRIAQVSPLYESVPPKLYGGTERVVSYLTEALVEAGHDVTLFASGDSKTKAKLIPVCDRALRLDTSCVDDRASHVAMIQLVQNELENFDVVHYHIDYLHYPVTRLNPFPHITTLHGRLNICELQTFYKIFSDMPVVSISNAQRKPLPNINWVGNVYHGLPRDLFRPNYDKGEYLAFVGRISPEKRVDRAIEIAIRSNLPLKIAAKIDKADKVYFEEKIKDLLDHPLVEFVGEIDDMQKQEFLARATALLFPIDWPEPFGLVMIESMACGTPVIAYRNGSVPEIMRSQNCGFVVTSQEDAIAAVASIDKVDRRLCRKYFEENFTAKRMAEDYLKIYQQRIERLDAMRDLKYASL